MLKIYIKTFYLKHYFYLSTEAFNSITRNWFSFIDFPLSSIALWLSPSTSCWHRGILYSNLKYISLLLLYSASLEYIKRKNNWVIDINYKIFCFALYLIVVEHTCTHTHVPGHTNIRKFIKKKRKSKIFKIPNLYRKRSKTCISPIIFKVLPLFKEDGTFCYRTTAVNTFLISGWN